MFSMSALSRHTEIDRRAIQYLVDRLDDDGKPLIRAHNFGRVSAAAPMFPIREVEILLVVRPLINIFGPIKIMDDTIPEVRAFMDENNSRHDEVREFLADARERRPTYLILEYSEIGRNMFLDQDQALNIDSAKWLHLHPCRGRDELKKTIQKLSDEHFSMTHLVVNFTRAIQMANRPVN